MSGAPIHARAAVLTVVGLVLLAGCAGSRPATLGVRSGRLAPCPRCGNCVSSQAPAKSECAVAPLRVAHASGDPLAALAAIISRMPRSKVITRRPRYLHAEFSSRLWGFVDDLELLLAADGETVHVRSASRVGRTDFGVNRERVEAMRAAAAKPTR